MRQVVVARHPQGAPVETDFALVEARRPRAGAGEVLLATEWISIDPYLRPLLGGRYLVPPPGPGEPVPGSVLGRVVVSDDPRLPAGTRVVADARWAEYVAVPATRVRIVDPAIQPPSLALGALGLAGLTAWAGLRVLATPKPGDTVLVSAAAGAVGSVAGQLARLSGARAIGVVGSARKAAVAMDAFGYAACADHRAPDLAGQLAALAPEGIDVYFDNVGGPVLEAALSRLRRNARVVLCGLIDQYNAAVRPPGPNLGPVIAARATLTGLVVHDHLDRWAQMQRELLPRVADGSLRCLEHVVEGLDAAPRAFCAMLQGENVGKTVVRLPEAA
jgi:hypothetical protein